MELSAAGDAFLFGGFRLDRRSGGLFRQDDSGGFAPVEIGSRALDVLAFLVAHQGQLLSKSAIIQAVWADVAVEEKNLTVQISNLRRVLDDGRKEASCIQTEAGRGYRFVGTVMTPKGEKLASPPPTPPDVHAPSPGLPIPNSSMANGALPLLPVARRRPRALELAGCAALLLATGFGAARWLHLERTEPVKEAPPAQSASAVGPSQSGLSQAPRLSLVVLPFDNLSGDPKDDYLADGITDDLTTDLSHISEAFVIARESAHTYKGKVTDVRQIGRELGVRTGSTRRSANWLQGRNRSSRECAPGLASA